MPLRRHVRALLAPTRFETPVLSYAEIVGSLQLSVAARVSEKDLGPRPAPAAVPARTATEVTAGDRPAAEVAAGSVAGSTVGDKLAARTAKLSGSAA